MLDLTKEEKSEIVNNIIDILYSHYDKNMIYIYYTNNPYDSERHRESNYNGHSIMMIRNNITGSILYDLIIDELSVYDDWSDTNITDKIKAYFKKFLRNRLLNELGI